MSKVSQIKIAEALGISQRTVSKALRNQKKVSEETRQLVLEKAKEFGYRPNALARAVIEGQSKTIGVLYLHFNPITMLVFLHVVQRELDTKGYRIIPCQWRGEPHKDNMYHLDLMLRYRVDGLIVCPRRHEAWKDTCFPELLESGQKMVFINDHARLSGCHSVYPDDYNGAKEGLLHLVENGHRHIICIHGFPEMRYNQSAILRWRAYKKVMKSIGQPCVQLLAYGDNEVPVEALKKAIEENSECTAFFCFNDKVAADLTLRLWDLGYRVPDDFSIIGYGDIINYHELMRTPITTVTQNPEDVADAAVKNLLKMISGESVKSKTVVNTTLIHRQSVKKIK